jgi:aminopeptidase N
LTVFRDQEFTADLNSRAVKRIADVRLLRSSQFPEDAGAMVSKNQKANGEQACEGAAREWSTVV